MKRILLIPFIFFSMSLVGKTYKIENPVTTKIDEQTWQWVRRLFGLSDCLTYLILKIKVENGVQFVKDTAKNI